MTAAVLYLVGTQRASAMEVARRRVEPAWLAAGRRTAAEAGRGQVHPLQASRWAVVRQQAGR